jgi:hypothetical protein
MTKTIQSARLFLSACRLSLCPAVTFRMLRTTVVYVGEGEWRVMGRVQATTMVMVIRLLLTYAS